MKTTFKKTLIAAGVAAVMGGIAGQAQAANWLFLQGTEPEGTAARAKVWGFIQAQYQKDYSDPNATGGYIPPKLIGPDLTTQESFNVFRARVGVRGTGFPLDSKVNYFFLVEFGNNGITQPSGSFAKITDASITLNHIKGARIRMGQFKTPMSEEVYQGIAIFDYINFTAYAGQQLIERTPNQRYTSNVPPQPLPVDQENGGLTRFDKSVSAARDTGIQIFDTFKVKNWEHSYSVMIGNGNGLNYTDNDNNKDTYIYLSTEYVFSPKGGPFRPGIKAYVWSQSGKRLLDNTNDSTYNPQEHDRKRYGIGFKYLKKPYRISGEYNKAEGMIFVGPQSPTFDMNPSVPPGNGEDGKADGWYIDLAWYIPGTKWELDFRYDEMRRLIDDPFETKWKTSTLGFQYHFNRKSRLTVNYAIRDVTAVNYGAGAGPNANLDGIGDRLALQLTHIF